MSFWTDTFGKQNIGEIIGGALKGVLDNKDKNNSNSNTNSGSNNNNNGGINLPVNFGLDNGSITKVFLWVGGIIVSTVLLIFAFKKRK